ncbi:MAG: protein kinase [Gemmatimonadales bacterium]
MSATFDRLVAALSRSYRIERELGAGGMATVYLAHDLKHDRDVAIKVLHPDLGAALGADRFLTEIRTTARLQHPHILPLLDSGEADGLLYYVMPLVTGETLRTRLERERQLPVEAAVLIAREVGDALGYAHGLGVIHRDIKPENILLQGGHALVADFGIALAVQTAGGTRMTQTGLSLGTPQYMSPEQAMGERAIDARSDIYALGAVTYEMLVGEPPFTGPSVQAIVARIMTEQPRALSTQRRSIPAGVEDAVLTALEKLPADRFASAAEFTAALGDQGGTKRHTSARSVAAPTRRSPAVIAALTVAGVCLGLIAGWFRWHSRTEPATQSTVLYALAIPDSLGLVATGPENLDYSPDGSVLAYVSNSGLMLRYSDSLEVRPVPGGRRGIAPFFSPDGRWIGYQVGSRVVKQPMAGGAAVTICEVCVGYQFQWGSDDTLRFHTAPADAPSGRVLMAVAANGGVAREIARPDSMSRYAYRSPILLPGTRNVLFSVYAGSSSRLAVLNLDTRKISVLDQAGNSPRWVASGYVVFATNDGTIQAVPFDRSHARPTGPPRVIARGVWLPDPYAMRGAVSATGAVVYAASRSTLPRRLMRYSRQGVAVPMVTELRGFSNPRFAPDGQRIAIDIAEDGSTGRDIWVLEVAHRTWSRITTDGLSTRPVFSRDGSRIFYSSNDDLWWIKSDGSGEPDSLLIKNGSRFAASMTAVGDSIVFQEAGGDRDGIQVLALDGTRGVRTLVPARFGESNPALSHDGRWLAYQSNETGRTEVYVRPWANAGRIPISLEGGSEPVWAHSGRELFYRVGDSLMVATLSTTPAFTVIRRTRLFSGGFLRGGDYREYDVAPDDQSFVVILGASNTVPLFGIVGAIGAERRRP